MAQEKQLLEKTFKNYAALKNDVNFFLMKKEKAAELLTAYSRAPDRPELNYAIFHEAETNNRDEFVITWFDQAENTCKTLNDKDEPVKQLIFLTKTQLQPYLNKKELPNKLKESGYIWTLSGGEAEDFLKNFPKNKTFIMFRTCSQPENIAIVISNSKGIKNRLIPYQISSTGSCLFSDGVLKDLTLELDSLVQHCRLTNEESEILMCSPTISPASFSIPLLYTPEHPAIEHSFFSTHIVNVEACKTFLSNIQDECNNQVIFTKSDAKNRICVFFCGSKKMLHITYTVDTTGSYRFTILSSLNNSICSNLSSQQLINKFNEWGFTILDRDTLLKKSKNFINKRFVPQTTVSKHSSSMYAGTSNQAFAPVPPPAKYSETLQKSPRFTSKPVQLSQAELIYTFGVMPLPTQDSNLDTNSAQTQDSSQTRKNANSSDTHSHIPGPGGY